MSLTLTSPAQTAQLVVTLQLHWTQTSREVPQKQVKSTLKTVSFLNPTRNIKVLNPFYGSLSTFSIVRFPFNGLT